MTYNNETSNLKKKIFKIKKIFLIIKFIFNIYSDIDFINLTCYFNNKII